MSPTTDSDQLDPPLSDWRWPAVIDERDLDFITSSEAKQLLLNCGVRLTAWREVNNLLPPTS